MSYKLLKFEKESAVPKALYVAVVEKVGAEDQQPFRVVVENLESEESALAEVGAWIAARNLEEEIAASRSAEEKAAEQADVTLGKLNESLK